MGEIIKKLNLQEKYIVDSNGTDKFIGWEKEFKDYLNKGYISINEKQTSFYIHISHINLDGSIDLLCKLITTRKYIFEQFIIYLETVLNIKI